MGTLNLIQDFLSQKRLAIVGVSRDPQTFSQKLFREFLQRGYDAVPVNPKAVRIAGLLCYDCVTTICPRVDGALLLVRPYMTAWAVRACARAEIRRVWMHRGNGTGSVNAEAVEFCRKNGIDVIDGYCPYMFLTNPNLFDRMHSWMMKANGTYPV
jgi:uncharacterized protein